MKTIKYIIFEKFNNVVYVGKTGSETMLSESRNTDIDVFVIVDGYHKEKEKILIEQDGYKLDVFVRDLNYYNDLIDYKRPEDPQFFTLIYNVFHEIIFDAGVKKFNFSPHIEELKNNLKFATENRGLKPNAKNKTLICKGINIVYLFKMLKENRTEITLEDKQNLFKIYNKDETFIREILKEIDLSIPDRIVRFI